MTQEELDAIQELKEANAILEQQAINRAMGLDIDTPARREGNIDDQIRADAQAKQQAELAKGFQSFYESEDNEQVEEIDHILFGDLPEEDQEASAEQNVDATANEQDTPKVVEDSEEVKQFKAEKEEVARLKAEALEEKRQAAEDQALLVKAMQALLEQQNQTLASKEKVVEEVKVPVVNQTEEEVKRKSKAITEKLLNAQDDAGDDLADLINQAVNSNRQTPITAEEISKIVEQSLQKKEQELQQKEIVKYNENFKKVNDEFFAKNAEFVKDETNMKLLSSNFTEIQNQYKNKGVLPNPEDLFAKAMAQTNADIEKYTGKKVVQKNTEVKVSESLKDEAAKSEAAKSATPKNSANATVTKPVTSNIKKSQHEMYIEMLAKQGIKF